MDANSENHDAGTPADWGNLEPGHEVEVREPGHPALRGVIDSITPDGSVLWLWIHGQSPRRMVLAGDPLVILTTSDQPDAF